MSPKLSTSQLLWATSDSSCWFSMFQKTLLYFNLWPLPLVLPLDATEKSLSPCSLHHPFRHLCTLILLHLLFSRLKSTTSLSLSSQERCLSHLRALSLDPLQRESPFFSILRSSTLDTILWKWPYLCSVEGQEQLAQPAGNNPPNTAQDNVCFAARARFWLEFNLVSTSMPSSFSAQILLDYISWT